MQILELTITYLLGEVNSRSYLRFVGAYEDWNNVLKYFMRTNLVGCDMIFLFWFVYLFKV